METLRNQKVIDIGHKLAKKFETSQILPCIKYEGKALASCLEKALTVSSTDSTVLIEGETGVGKQMLAELIHEQSKRSNHEMITVDCSALDDNLMLSDFFGHEKGAFTDAKQKKEGFFEIADGSTIFLDEIGELPLSVQARLLRILQEGVYCRLGSARIRETDVRVIVATNKNLKNETAEKRFRKDLFYRLDVFRINVPPLRSRTKDIAVLAEHFKCQIIAKGSPRVIGFSEKTMAEMKNYDWPGNVRELQNAVTRGIINCRQSATIEPQHLELKSNTKFCSNVMIPISGYIPITIEEYEKVAFCLALHFAGEKGQSEAADILGISRKSIPNKVRKKHNINTDDPLRSIEHLKATNFPLDVARLRSLEMTKNDQEITTDNQRKKAISSKDKETLEALFEELSQREKSLSFLQTIIKTLLSEKKNAMIANKNASKKILNLEATLEKLQGEKIEDIKQIGALKTIERNLKDEIAKLKDDLTEEMFKTLHSEKELALIQEIMKEFRKKLDMKDGSTLRKQIAIKNNHTDSDPKKAHSDMESDEAKIIIELVIKKHDGVAKKAFKKHQNEFKKIGIRTVQTLHKKIKLLGLADQCKETRVKYCEKIITKKLVEKHSFNFFSVAKEIGVPANEVSKFCEQFVKIDK
ncbi:MAG: sigma 54-interacting transcriptional regulator [Patescibacteria group bacterium]|nr:sigma 54-interacting transcriptional regulator [Patescibacteria group bacterium]